MLKIFLTCLLLCSCATQKSIAYVNKYVNYKYNYIPEENNKDYWKTPKEFKLDNGGDCEDFAIYKCSLLSDKKTSILVIQKGKLYHAVLLVNDFYILDNLENHIYTIKELIKNWKIVYIAENCAKKEILYKAFKLSKYQE